jgi:hypothetical protein
VPSCPCGRRHGRAPVRERVRGRGHQEGLRPVALAAGPRQLARRLAGARLPAARHDTHGTLGPRVREGPGRRGRDRNRPHPERRLRGLHDPADRDGGLREHRTRARRGVADDLQPDHAGRAGADRHAHVHRRRRGTGPGRERVQRQRRHRRAAVRPTSRPLRADARPGRRHRVRLLHPDLRGPRPTGRRSGPRCDDRRVVVRHHLPGLQRHGRQPRHPLGGSVARSAAAPKTGSRSISARPSRSRACGWSGTTRTRPRM